MTTENQLLPCPFCGSEPTDHAIEPHSHSFTLDGFKMPDHKGSHVIECKCGAGFVADTLNAATALWNARAALTQPAQPAEGGEAVKASWWMRETEDGFEWTDTAPLVRQGWTPLYTAPPASHVPEADFGNTPPASQEQAQQPSEDVRELSKWLNEETSAPINRQALARVLAVAQQPSGGEVKAAPVESYPAQDQAFYAFWYSHMKGDLMQPPLADISHSTARYIWDSALATPKPEPMTDEQIANVVLQTVYAGDDSTPHRNAWAREIGIPFARAIEAHHGITKGSESAACSVCEGKGHVYRDGRCIGFCRCPAGRNALALNLPPAPITKEQA